MSTIHASTVTRSGTSSVKAAPTGPGAVTVSGSVGGVMVDEPKAKKSRQSAAVVKLSAHRVIFYRLFSHN